MWPKRKRIGIALGVLALYVALTAIGGGIAILVGTDRFPPEWLRGTPFSVYTVPALVLAMVVGGSSLLAAVMLLTGRALGVLASMTAGLLLTGFILVELVVLNDNQSVSGMEALYLGLGLLIFGVATYLYIVEERHSTIA